MKIEKVLYAFREGEILDDGSKYYRLNTDFSISFKFKEENSEWKNCELVLGQWLLKDVSLVSRCIESIEELSTLKKALYVGSKVTKSAGGYWQYSDGEDVSLSTKALDTSFWEYDYD